MGLVYKAVIGDETLSKASIEIIGYFSSMRKAKTAIKNNLKLFFQKVASYDDEKCNRHFCVGKWIDEKNRFFGLFKIELIRVE